MACEKILVVDDEPRLLAVVVQILESQGFEVVTAESGAECMEKVRADLPDLILLDIMMPALTGWETMAALDSAGFGDIPVIILSAKAKQIEGEHVKEADILGYIEKPFEARELVERIEEAVEEEDT